MLQFIKTMLWFYAIISVGEIDVFTTVENALNKVLRNKVVYSDFFEIDPGVLKLLFGNEWIKLVFGLRGFHELIDDHVQVEVSPTKLEVYDESLMFCMDDYIDDAEHKFTN